MAYLELVLKAGTQIYIPEKRCMEVETFQK